MSPNLTAIVYALGAGDKLVGVDEYSVYPPEARYLPRMGSYLQPNMEALIAARPDLVLVVNSDEKIREMLSGVGLEFESFGNDTVADVLDSIGRLGTLLQCQRTSGWLLQAFERRKNYVTSTLENTPRTRVVLVVGRNPGRLQDIYVAGSSSFMGELLVTAGGDNVFGGLGLPWPQVGVESIVSADPDVIIDSTLSKGATDAEFEQLGRDWDALPSLRAVKNGRVIVPRDGWWQIPGPYMDATLMLLAHWLHPDVFPAEVPSPYEKLELPPQGSD